MEPSLDNKPAVSTPAKIVLCPYARTSHAYHLETRECALIARACRRKKCQVCADTARKILVRRITDAAPERFITLSVRHEGDPQESLNTCTHQFRRLIQTLRRRHGPMEYVRIIEYCVDGYPHLHILQRGPYIPQRELSELWSHYTGATVVDIRKAHGRSTRYVAKYISKATADQSQWNRQTVSASRGFWRDKPWFTEFIAFWEVPEPLTTYAAKLAAHHAIVRLRPGVYWMWERSPGDELPEELLPC